MPSKKTEIEMVGLSRSRQTDEGIHGEPGRCKQVPSDIAYCQDKQQQDVFRDFFRTEHICGAMGNGEETKYNTKLSIQTLQKQAWTPPL